VVILACVCLPLLADEPAAAKSVLEVDRPGADVLLLQEAARKAVAFQRGNADQAWAKSDPDWHSVAERRITHQIALCLAQRGQFADMFAYFNKFNGLNRHGQPLYEYRDFWDLVGEDAFARNDFQSLAKFLPFVPKNVSRSQYVWSDIITRCLELGRDEEAEIWIRVFTKQDKEQASLANLNARRQAYASFEREKDGTLASDALALARIVVETFAYEPVPDKLGEAVRLTRQGKDDQAKALFDNMLADIPDAPSFRSSGSSGNAPKVCGIATLLIELGRPEWAREALKKAQACDEAYFKDFGLGPTYHRHAYSLGCIADVKLKLGDTNGARELIEKAYTLRHRSPTHCELAVKLAAAGDRAGAVDVLRNVMSGVDGIDHDVTRADALRSLFDATVKIGEDELFQEFVEHVLTMAERLAEQSERKGGDWRLDWRRDDLLHLIVKAQILAGRVDDADGMMNRFHKRGFGSENSAVALAEALVLKKRYKDARVIVDARISNGSSHGDENINVRLLRTIARAQCLDGDKSAASETLQAALDAARAATHANNIAAVAMDLREQKGPSDDRSAMDIVKDMFPSTK